MARSSGATFEGIKIEANLRGINELIRAFEKFGAKVETISDPVARAAFGVIGDNINRKVSPYQGKKWAPLAPSTHKKGPPLQGVTSRDFGLKIAKDEFTVLYEGGKSYLEYHQTGTVRWHVTAPQLFRIWRDTGKLQLKGFSGKTAKKYGLDKPTHEMPARRMVPGYKISAKLRDAMVRVFTNALADFRASSGAQ